MQTHPLPDGFLYYNCLRCELRHRNFVKSRKASCFYTGYEWIISKTQYIEYPLSSFSFSKKHFKVAVGN